MLLALTVACVLATDPRPAAAIADYERGDYAKARPVLLELVEDTAVPEAEKQVARTYLAATYHVLGERAAAKGQLLELVRRHPAARVDPQLFLPELVVLFEEARAEVSRERIAAEALKPPPSRPVPAGVWWAGGGALFAAVGAASFTAIGLQQRSEFDGYRERLRSNQVAAGDAWTEQVANDRAAEVNRNIGFAVASGALTVALAGVAVYLWRDDPSP